MKPAAWRFAHEIYPVSTFFQTRYRDMDMLQHVNNVSIAAYYDEARHRFSQAMFAQMDTDAGRIVTADSHVHYLGEVFHPSEIEIATGIQKIGSASYQLGQAMFVGGGCVGVCASTFVHTTAKGAAPLPAALRQALQSYLIAAPAAAA